MTQDKAKTRFCPQTLHARLMIVDQVPQPVEIAGATCIGAACMAWRWKHPQYNDGVPEGYCGLAGKP